MISTALIRFQLAGFAKSSHAVPPYVLALVVLVILDGGNSSPALSSYATSAIVVFPVLGWTARSLIDAEPDGQRALSVAAVGGRLRAQLTTLVSATLACLPIVVAAIAMPWLLRSAYLPRGEQLPMDLALGTVLQLLTVAPAVLLGAWASRAVIAGRGWSMLALLSTCLGSILVSVQAWGGVAVAAPPLAGSARDADRGPTPLLHHLPLLGVQLIVWCAVVGAGWLTIRRRRA